MHPHNVKLINGKPSGQHELYRTWKGMRERCSNPNHKDWKHYGDKGISVDVEWDDFERFVLDMGERPYKHTLDRIDGDKNYSKDNCRWATASQQALNQKKRVRGFTKGAYKNSKTGVVGVYIMHNGTFRAVKFVNGKNKHVGCFKTLEQAIEAKLKY